MNVYWSFLSSKRSKFLLINLSSNVASTSDNAWKFLAELFCNKSLYFIRLADYFYLIEYLSFSATSHFWNSAQGMWIETTLSGEIDYAIIDSWTKNSWLFLRYWNRISIESWSFRRSWRSVAQLASKIFADDKNDGIKWLWFFVRSKCFPR